MQKEGTHRLSVCPMSRQFFKYATVFIAFHRIHTSKGVLLMSRVHNEPKCKNGLLQAIRAQLEHRAFWLYLLCDEAAKRGLDPRDFGSAAVKRCGLSQGAGLVKKGKTDSLKGLKKRCSPNPPSLFSRWTCWRAPTTSSPWISTTALW